jgi:hypothetical protein
MNTECSAERINFHGLGGRGAVGRFDGGRISSDGGCVLLREVEERTHILNRLAGCFVASSPRSPGPSAGASPSTDAASWELRSKRKLKDRNLQTGAAPTCGYSSYGKTLALVSTHPKKDIDEGFRYVSRVAVHHVGRLWELHHCLDPRWSM